MEVVNKKLRTKYGWAEKGVAITLDTQLTKKKHLEILLHEGLHMLNWDMSEEKVTADSRKLANLLWKERYRRVEM